MNLKFLTLLSILFLNSTQLGFAQRDNFTNDLRSLLEYSMTNFESIRGDKIKGGSWYKANKSIAQFDTRLHLNTSDKIYYSQSETIVRKKMANVGTTIKQYEKKILDALPATYKSKSGLTGEMESEIKSSGTLLYFNKTRHVTCFYEPSEQMTKPKKHPKLFLTWFPIDGKTTIVLYVIAPQNGKRNERHKPSVSTISSKSVTPVDKKRTPTKTKETAPKTMTISNVSGTYIGYATGWSSNKRINEKRYKIVINKNYTATLGVEKDGKWLTLFDTNIKEVEFKFTKYGDNVYHFKSSLAEFGDIRIFISRGVLNPEYTDITIKEGKTRFHMKRIGGPPICIKKK